MSVAERRALWLRQREMVRKSVIVCGRTSEKALPRAKGHATNCKGVAAQDRLLGGGGR